ncbi:hypothetical protein OH76DRAFT_63516 [Lentinus brumalis]|uniref:Uncharacterized protein n=1 Tax=Lentinus brumalis TaxID=2498619 RepID=A0A371DKG2_9APHY|nr:hypothetical protein OH76DRAFT_63516 [Polyporus brumalis]
MLSCLSSLRSFRRRLSLAFGRVHRSLIVLIIVIYLQHFYSGLVLTTLASYPPSSPHLCPHHIVCSALYFYTRTQCKLSYLSTGDTNPTSHCVFSSIS